MNEEQIKKAIADGIAGALKGLPDLIKAALPETIKAALPAAIADALKPTTEAVAALGTRLEGVEKKAAETPKPEAKKEGEGKTGAVDIDAVVAAVAKALEPKLKVVDELHAKTTKAEGDAANTARVRAWLKANRPNLPKASLESWEAKLLAANAKDEAGVAAAFEAEIKLLTPILGADAVKPFMADFKGEGGKAGEGGSAADADAEAAKLIEQMKSAPKGAL